MRLTPIVAMFAIALAGCAESSGEAKPTKAASQPAKAASQPAHVPTNAKPPPMAPPESEAKALFVRACTPCPGMDGTGSQMRGMMPKLGDLTSAELHARLNDADFLKLIMGGRGKMPPFTGALTPEQAKKVIAYTRTLKR